MISKLVYNIKYFINLTFIIFFFPSFVSGVFLPNLLCGLFIFYNLVINFDKIKINFVANILPSILFFIFYIILIFSTLSSNYTLNSLHSSALYFVLFLYCSSLVILFNENKNFLRLFFLCGLFTCFFLSIDAVYEFFNGNNILGHASIEGRIAGMFGDRWLIGRFLIYIMPVLVGIFFLEFNDLKKYSQFFVISLLLISLTIIFSGERAAFLIFFIYFLLIFFFFLRKIEFKKSLFLLLLIIVFITLPFIFSETSERIQNNFILYLTSTDYEKNPYLSLFMSSWNMFIENPFLGIGPNNFRLACSENLYYVSKLSCSTHPHSITFQLLAEVGIFGFIFVFSLFVYFAKECFLMVLSKNFNNTSFGLFSLKCSIVLYLFPFMITGNFFLSWYSFIYYLPLAIYIYYLKKLKTTK